MSSIHEYGHGLRWRMIGGMERAARRRHRRGRQRRRGDAVNGDDTIGEYAGSSPNGIRRFPYAGYPLTYGAVTGQEVHNDGEIYAAVVWRLIELFGPARRSRALHLLRRRA